MKNYEEMIKKIENIIKMTEEIQDSNESRYTKQCAVETAYEHICMVIQQESEEEE